tara:strand:+ start:1303 stop:4041 length:2739 start_codon:yes stop_codon:yes gene_type:complete
MPEVNLLGKTLELENPSAPTENDIVTIKNTFRIPLDYSLDQTRSALAQMQEAQSASTQTNILADIPPQFPPGSPEYNNLMAEKIADVNNRVKFSNDPLNYISNNLSEKYIRVPGTNITPLPKDIISKPSAEMIGGFTGLVAAGGIDFLTRGVARNPSTYLAGEYLGTMAGGQTYDLVNDFLRYANGLEPREVEEKIDQGLHDAYLNLAFTGGSMVAAPIFNAFKSKIGRATFGIKPKSESYKKAKELSDTYGIPYSIIQATNYGLWKSYPKVIGVFPWVGKPFKTQQQSIDESIRQYLKTMANGLAPTQTIFNLSGDITNIFKNNYKSVRAAQGILFDDFYKYADKLRGKKIIDITAFKGRAGDVAERFQGNVPEGSAGQLRFPGDSAQKAFGNFYQDLQNLPDQITMEQAIELKRIFSDFTANFEGTFKGGKVPIREASALNKLALVLEKDYMNLKNIDNAIDAAVFETAQKKYATAVDFFSNSMSRFEGGVPGSIKMAKPSFFSPGADVSGMLYTDEAFKVILERAKNSKEAMEHLIDLAQPSEWELKAYAKAGNKDGVLENVEVYLKDMDPDSKTFEQYVKKTIPVVSAGPQSSKKRIMRKLIDDAFYKSIQGLPAGKNYTDFLDEVNISPEAIRQKGLEKVGQNMMEYKDVVFGVKEFEKSLGLDNPDGIEILKTVLDGTGTKVDDIRNFLAAAEKAGSFVVPDASTFLQRRLTLTGFRGLLLLNAGKQAAKTGAGVGITLTNVMIPLIMRYGSELLTDPKALKAMTEVIDTNVVSASNMTTLMNWANGTSMPKDNEDAEMLDRIQEIDSAVFNLMKTPQTEQEFMPAREEQFKMEQTGRLDQNQTLIQNYLNQVLNNPAIPVSSPVDMPTFTPNPSQLPRAVQQELATGTIDDAINQQMLSRGLGSL